MRFILVLAFGSLIGIMGCGDDGGGPGGTGGAGGTGGTGGAGGDAGGGEAPVISEIAWAPVGACQANVSSDWTITVTASDADTAAGMLTYDGNVPTCPVQPTIDGAVSTVTCPNILIYNGTVTVSDPESNSDTETFAFGGGGASACMAGSQTF